MGTRGRRVMTSRAVFPSVQLLPSITGVVNMRLASTARNMFALIWFGAGVVIWVQIFSILFGVG